MITQLLVQDKVEAFGERMMAVLNEAALALMASIGHRTGLFDTMARMEPATSERIAAEANLSERYVREWLGAMVTAYVVEYDPQRQTYRLPPEHAAWLTRAATPQNVAASMQFISVLGGVEDLVVEAFRHGRGVPYSAYKRFYPVMAEESAQTVVSVLFDHILPLVPGLRERLEGGIDVMDVGCGSGWALIEMAAAFPRSRFTGVDLSEEGIADGRARAQQRGLTNIELLVRDAATIDYDGRFDLIVTFDAVHDQARPDLVLANIHRALRGDGIYLMQDIKGSSHVHCNMDHPAGTYIYTISCMHCMSVSLANGGMGLGAMWGKEKALEMLAEAGFVDVQVNELPHDPMNYYYVSRKGPPLDC